MTQQNWGQVTFSSGEVSPDLESRTDIERYSSGLSKSKNVLCTNKGDLIPRPGTIYVDESITSTEKQRLIPFKFSDDESYMIELTNQKMRIFKDGISISPIISKLYVDEHQYPVVDSPDHVFLGRNSFPYSAGAGPFSITNIDGSSITGATLEYYDSDLGSGAAVTIDNDSQFWIHSVIRDEVGTTSHNQAVGQNLWIGKSVDIVYITMNPALVGVANRYFKLKTRVSDGVDTIWNFSTLAAGDHTTATPIEYLDTPWLESEIDDVQFAAVGDLVFFTHENYQPMKLSRLTSTNFRISKHHTSGGPWRNYPTYDATWGGPYQAYGNTTFDGYAWTSGAGFKLRDPGNEGVLIQSDGSVTIPTDSNTIGRHLRIAIPTGLPTAPRSATPAHGTVPNINEGLISIDGQAVGNFHIPSGHPGSRVADAIPDFEKNGTPSFIYMEAKVQATRNPGSASAHPNPTNFFHYKITRPAMFYRSSPGTRYLGVSNQNKIGRLFEETQADGTGGWPSCVAIFDSRLVYASNSENPNTMALSAKGDFDDFQPDDWGGNTVNTLTETSLFSWSVGSTRNPETFAYHSFVYSMQEGLADKILWLKTTNYGLIAGTPNGIYLSTIIGRNRGASPDDFDMRLVSEEGASKVQPEYIDGKVYYINKLGDKLLSMEYNQDADGFKPLNETLISEHLLKDGIKAISFARTPIRVLWMVTNAGTLISSVFLESENTKGFFQHQLASPSLGRVNNPVCNSIATIPSDDLTFDQLWISSTRNLYGNVATTGTSKYNSIEKLSNYSPFLSDTKQFIGLDSSRTYLSQAKTITDVIVGAETESGSYKARITCLAHGVADTEKVSIIGLRGSLSFINNGALYTIARIDADTFDIILTGTPSGNKTAPRYSSGGFVIPRFSYTEADDILTNQATNGAHILSNGAYFERGALYANSNSTYSDDDTVTGTAASQTVVTGVSLAHDTGLMSTLSTSARIATTTNLYVTSGSINKFTAGETIDIILDTGATFSPTLNSMAVGPGFDIFYISPGFPSAMGVGNVITQSLGTQSKVQFAGDSETNAGFTYNMGYKPNVYFTTLPPVMNNQLGVMDANDVSISSVSVRLLDSYQIKIRRDVSPISDDQDLIDDSVAVTALDVDAVRKDGIYTVQLENPEDDPLGKIRFTPETGYPFRIIGIYIRGERATRP